MRNPAFKGRDIQDRGQSLDEFATKWRGFFLSLFSRTKVVPLPTRMKYDFILYVPNPYSPHIHRFKMVGILRDMKIGTFPAVLSLRVPCPVGT